MLARRARTLEREVEDAAASIRRCCRGAGGGGRLPQLVFTACVSLFRSLSESFFMVKGAALFLQQGSSHQGQKAHPNHKHAGEGP